MTASCGHIPLSTDAAQRAIADQHLQLAKAAACLPEGSAVRAWLQDCMVYADNALGLLGGGASVQLLLGALGRHVAATGTGDTLEDIALLRSPIAADLWLALGGHAHVEEARR